MRKALGHLEANEEIVADDIEVVFDVVEEAGGLKSWADSIIGAPATLDRGEVHTLVLQDGGRGQIIIERIGQSGGRVDVSFQGTGPAP